MGHGHDKALDQIWPSTAYLLINDLIERLAPPTVSFLHQQSRERDSNQHIDVDDGGCRRSVLWALTLQSPSLPR